MYTHTLTINLEGVDVEAEISFDSGQDVKVKFPDETEASGEVLGCLTHVLDIIASQVRECGEIYKFEIIKK